MAEHDPYRQHKAEHIEEKLAADPNLKLSDPVLYKGGLDSVLGVVRVLQHKCGFPERHYQVKFCALTNVLRLSDYTTRHACEPGDHFWMLGDIIMGGDLIDYEEVKAKLEAEKNDEPTKQ